MRILAVMAIVVVMLSTGCGSSAGPTGDGEIRAAVLAALEKLDTGIEREDPFLASSPAGELFRMNNNIAVRYSDQNFEGRGADSLRSTLSTAFDLHANTLHNTTLTDLVISGEVATATAEVEFNSLRVDKTPPENFTSTSTDIFVFTLDQGEWKIRNWEEPPVEEPPAEEEPTE